MSVLLFILWVGSNLILPRGLPIGKDGNLSHSMFSESSLLAAAVFLVERSKYYRKVLRQNYFRTNVGSGQSFSYE